MPQPERVDVETMLQRMCSEYLEMPGLHLTCRQAQRLWNLDEATCLELLRILLDVGFLRQTRNGTFARTTDGPAPRLRMARASLDSAGLTRDTEPLPRAGQSGPRR